MPIGFGLHQDIITTPIDLNKTTLIFMLGPELHRRALATAVLAWQNLKIEANTAISIIVDGYDNDPRELWEIAEVCAFIQKFCAKTRAHTHPALEPMSRNVLLLCGADPTKRVIRRPISREEATRQSLDFIDKRTKDEP